MQRRIRKPSWKVEENQQFVEERSRAKEEKRKQQKERLEARKARAQVKAQASQKKAEEGKAERETKKRERAAEKARALDLRRHKETVAERRERLRQDSERLSIRLNTETAEQRQERLQKHSQCESARLQAQTAEQKQERLQRRSQCESARLQAQTAEQKHERLQKDSEAKKRKRASQTQEEMCLVRSKETAAKRHCRTNKASASQSIKEASHAFNSAIRDGPNYVCVCCHRLMYRKTVVVFSSIKYNKVSDNLLHSILGMVSSSVEQKVWICKTCDFNLKRGKMPAQAKANNLALEDIPAVLSDLNPMEVRLISLRIPFMKMVALPCGKQRAIHGPAVNVPTDLHPVCDLLPRLPSQAQIVPMKLKRKLCYKGHYMYQYVRPAKVIAALEWLKENNPHYRDVPINSDWQEDSARDDAELWEAISSQHGDCSSQEVNTTSNPATATPANSNLEMTSVVKDSVQEELDEDFSTLVSLARDRGFTLKDVPRDGNCLFSSVQLQLQKLGIKLGEGTMRQQLVAYFEDHPYTSDGTTHLREYIAAPLRSTDSRNADTEMRNEEDEFLDSIEDTDTRLQVRWCKYLEKLGTTAWGDHVAVQGLADMLHVDIHVLSTINPNTAPIQTCHTAVGTIHLGLVGQFHYMSMEVFSNQRVSPTRGSRDCCPQDPHVLTLEGENKASPQIPVSEDERSQIEDEEALNHQAQLRGLPYASVLHREDVDVGADNVFSVAPGEGQKPIAILTDPHFEEMCNPTMYPFGNFGLMANREKKLTVRKYFNQRLLDADGRFAKDVEYLLTAQYAVESKQVTDDASIMLRQSQGRLYRGQMLTAGAVKDQQVLHQMMQRDDAYRFLKNVRGSPAYFQRVMYDVLGMIRQLGLPTWFLTLSAADMQWPDVIQTIARQYGSTFTDEEVAAMSFDDKSKWLRQNPVTAARHFQHRLNTFFQVFLKSKANPLGELVDYAIRIEFQARGSPHAHTILWIKDAPKLGVHSDQVVCNFIDRYVYCNIPQDEELAQLVSKVQKHRHSATCRRNGRCRFHYPRPPSPVTVVARQEHLEMDSNEEADDPKAVLLTVRKTLDDSDTPDGISLDELLDKAGVSHATYMQGLKICSKGNSVVMQRTPSESWINTYNPDVIRVWKANMDLQYILDPYACVMYIASYMLKSEKSMSELLKQVSKECRGEEIKTQLRRLGSVFLNHREVSAQEAVYRILSLPLKQLSRKVVFVNASPKEERIALLKSANQLENMDDDSEDIYHTSLIDRYAQRPDALNDMCLAEFAANYTSQSGQELDEGETNDTLPQPEQDVKMRCPRIQLKNGLGSMHKRTREAIIRFHRFNREKEESKLYRSKLMLYFPWRDESTDLLGGYADFCSHYEAKSDGILENEQKYSHNATLINEAVDDLTEHGPPQHAWDQVAPGAAEQQARDQAEGVEEERSIEQEDLDANARLLQQQHHGRAPLLQRFTAETNRELLSPDDYRAAIRGLNKKQRQIVMFHRKWCKGAITALRSGQQVKPYRIFLSGPGGVGKSHVISIIRNDTVKLLRLSGQLQPEDVIVLLTAPTGAASFNIVGMTLHSALLLSTGKFSNQPLAHDKLNTLRMKLSNLQLLIIDEVSMVGSNMLLQIHRRLQQLKGSKEDTVFGNLSILAVGDLFQLQPVAQPYVFDEVGDAYARLHKSGSLWTDEFYMVELDEIMRQKEDQQFAQLLCRVRKAECTEEDFHTLKSRVCEDCDPGYPHHSLHVYRLNRDVDEYNIHKLNRLAPEDQHVVIHALDSTKDKHTRQLDMTMPKSKANTGGLVGELHLAMGAKVMLTVNIDVSDGLVNGARGTVEAIIKTGSEVSLVLVKFDHQRVGLTAISQSQYRNQHPSAVPISRHEAVFNIGRNKAAEVSRRQFPLVLAWSTTIHKVQGLTLDQIVVDMKGQVFNAGQAYVAFSRVRSLQGLFIKNFNPSSIKVSAAVVHEMERLTSERLLPQQPLPQVVTLPKTNWIKIGHLNVRSYISKLEDITSDTCIAHTDIMCFTETFLKPHQHVNSLTLNGESSVIYRCDRVATSTENLSNGGVMIACASSIHPQSTGIPQPPSLEIESIIVHPTPSLTLCVIVVYRRPQLPLSTFLSLLQDYLGSIQYRSIPTLILGDFNENLLSCAGSSKVPQFMSPLGFSQLVKVPTTDSGSLLDHIYCNHCDSCTVDVVDTYYSDHDACFFSKPLSS